jgi:site-specific recombinase XerD
LEPLPAWVQEPLQAYLTWRWRNWQPHLAGDHARRLARRLRSSWDWLLTHASVQGWSDLHRGPLEAWLQARQQAGLAASTQAYELCVLRSFLRFAADQDLPVAASLFRVAYPTRPDLLPRALSEAEYRRLEQEVLRQTAAPTPQAARDRAWFFTLAHTGIRVSELLHLRWSDLDLASGRLLVRGGKATRDRRVYLTPRLRQALQDHQGPPELCVEGPLWRAGEAPLQAHQVRYRLRQWGRQAQVAVTPHRLRHTLATRLINQEMSLEALRRLLGHRNLRMTQHYARLHDATVQQQFQAAMAALEGKEKPEGSPSPEAPAPV